MGKTCKLKDVSFQCMTKFTTNLKKKKKVKKKLKKKYSGSNLNFWGQAGYKVKLSKWKLRPLKHLGGSTA